jgi:DNA-binding CsgD family transcriptional regulator
MGPADLAALQFLRDAEGIRELGTLETRFGEVVGGFGYDHFTCMHVADPGRPLAPRLLAAKAEAAWDAHYFEAGYLKDDPCIPALYTYIRPYSWSEMAERSPSPRAAAMFGEAADAGHRNGLVVPIHGAAGEIKAVRLISSERELDPGSRSVLFALSVVMAERATTLVEAADDEPLNSPLTRRETECLLWVGEHKSDWEIGAILNISQATVHEHVENAKRKLGCSRRTQAWSLAMARGWLAVPL